MAKSNDWLPGPRKEILAMCRTWLFYMTEARRTAWGVPAASLSYPGGPHTITARLGPLAGTAEPDPRSDYFRTHTSSRTGSSWGISAPASIGRHS